MLLELRVRNLAIIQEVEICFGPGLNVLTGETGAGKSILMAALNLLLGGRSDRELVRTGTSDAWAEALFENDSLLHPLLGEWGIPFDAGEPLSLRRVVNANGRSRAYINCVSVPAQTLRQLAPFLIDFGRQHEQSILLNPENHLDLLDRYAGAEEQRQAVAEAHQQVSTLLAERHRLEQSRPNRSEREEFLQYQLDAILRIAPQPGEEESLTQQLEELSLNEKRRDLAQQGEKALYSDSESVQEHLAAALSLVEKLTELDESLVHVYEDLRSALISVEEGAHTLGLYRKSVPQDPNLLSELQERLDEVVQIQERFGGSYESLVERQGQIEEELDELAHQDERLSELNNQLQEGRHLLAQATQPLQQKRKEAASHLEREVERELADLAMKGARFQVQFVSLEPGEGGVIACPHPNDPHESLYAASWGTERAAFLLSANVGEDLRPLERVASGGELSRILLALKRVLAQASSVQSFVFDEIDAGVAGAAATTVAKKLRQIAGKQQEHAQIICISHTPQIAAEANRHFRVEKQTRQGRTRSLVRLLSNEERILEVARMLAGDQSMEQALQLARQLVRVA